MHRHWMVLVALALSACGGGGSDDGGSTGPDVLDPARQQAALDTLADGLSRLSFTPDLPTTGDARYEGFAGLAAEAPGRDALFLTGSAVLTARFAAGTISGRIDGFSAVGGGDVGGALTIGNGTTGITGFSGDLEGTLRAWGGERTVSGRVSGAFLGPSAEGLAGVVDTGLSGGGALTGEVWAKR